MHIETLPNPLQTLLRYAGTDIKPLVMIKVTTLQVMPNGSFGPLYATYRFDISDRVLNWPSISMERPRWPVDGNDKGVAATECQLVLDNSDGKFGVAQTGSILRGEDIEQAIVDIYATVDGVITNWFSGRVVGRPTETAGKTTFIVSGYLWECIRKPVKYENFGLVSRVVMGLPRIESQTVSGTDTYLAPTTVHVDAVGQHFCIHHGLIAFDGGGRAITRLNRSGTATIALQSLRIANAADLGKYTIKFKTPKTYTLSTPRNAAYTGSIRSGLPADSPIQISASDWSGDDGSGVEINFWVSWTAVGNGIAMAYHLLEKGLLDNWGVFSGSTVAKIDVQAFTYWARRFAGMTIHVDATNATNDVFEGKGDNRPLEYGTLVNNILAHYQCSLTMLIDGTISITGPYIDDRPAYPHDTSEAIVGDTITLQGGDTINYITVQFGGDPSGGFAAPIYANLNPTAPQRVEKVFSLPYIKVGIGTRFALWWERTMVRRMMVHQTLVNYDLEAGHGLLMNAGDRITVQSNALPVIDQVCEVVSVTREIGSGATVVAAMVQDGEGPAAIVNISEVGGVGIW